MPTPPLPRSRPRRLLPQLIAVAAILLGIVLMHSAPLVSPADASAGHHGAATSEHRHHTDASATPVVAERGCEDGHCSAHTALHLCMAVVVVAALLTISRRHLLGVGAEQNLRPRVSWLRHGEPRAPPWTTPTLAQLSILRV